MNFRPLLLMLASLVLGSGCFWTNEHPCPDGVREGDVNYRDGFFYTTDGLIYGQAGSSPIRECHTITGNIVLSGVIEHFEDFENIESVRGFFYNGADLPRTGDVLPDVDPAYHNRGLIQGFPNLREILRDQMYTSAFVEPQEGGIFYDGFGQLAYVGGDYGCAGTEAVGQSLVEVEGTLHCDNSRLENLEAVGKLTLDGNPLPNLTWAGRIRMPAESLASEVDLPSLQQVGPHEEEGGLVISGAMVESLAISSLDRVEGDLLIRGLGVFAAGVQVEGRAEEVREQFAGVEVTGEREICRNDPTDPCPWDDDCEDVYGADSILCCELDWPECLEIYGQPPGP